MKIPRFTVCPAVALCLLASCAQKDERGDAAMLARALSAAQPKAAAAAAEETDTVTRARAWCGSMTTAGTGHDVGLERNTAVAAEFAKTAAESAKRWDEIRQELTRARVRSDFPRELRTRVLAAVTKHLAQVENLRAALDETVKQFRVLAQDRSYTGDTVPPVVTKLDGLLGSFDPAGDEIGAALAELRAKLPGL